MTIENICGTLKTAIIEKLPDYIAELTTDGTAMKLFDSDSVKVGYIDLDKNPRAAMCFIVPDFQSVTEASIEVDEEETRVQVYFLCGRIQKTIYSNRLCGMPEHCRITFMTIIPWAVISYSVLWIRLSTLTT